MKVVIVGAGLASAIAVYLLKKYYDCDIMIYEKGNIGGLMYNKNVNGITVQAYGPHVFHTTNNIVRDLMLEIFTKYNIKWESYYLQALANVNNTIYQLPFSKSTGLTHDEYINKIIKPYTKKQWGEYNESAVKRMHELNYYTSHYHTTALFSCVFDHTEFFKRIFECCNIINEELSEQQLEQMDADIKIYTGYREGCQFKRTQFKHEITTEDQGCLQMNYPDLDKEYTRVMDFCYLSNNPIKADIHPICKEIPILNDNSTHMITYPIGNTKRSYNVVYLGRFGTHKYLDMDQVVMNVIEWFNKL